MYFYIYFYLFKMILDFSLQKLVNVYKHGLPKTFFGDFYTYRDGLRNSANARKLFSSVYLANVIEVNFDNFFI